MEQAEDIEQAGCQWKTEYMSDHLALVLGEQWESPTALKNI